MHSIVVGIIRNRIAETSGGDLQHVTLNTNVAESVCASEDEVIRIHEASGELSLVSARAAWVWCGWPNALMAR